MASKTYDIAFKLAAKMDKTYGDVFKAAEDIANRAIGKIAKTAMAIGGAVLSVDTIKDSIDKAISFESAMADVAKVVDGLKDSSGRTTEAYAVMSKELLEMTSYLPMTAEELAQITAAAGQAGIATEDLTIFTEAAAKMGIAFDVTAEQAGQFMAQWRTSFKMSQREVTTLADQINYLSNNSSESAVKLSDVVSRIGSLAEISGLSAAEVAAIGASMTGVSSEISATGIKNLMRAMNAGNSATNKQIEILDRLGFSATGMAERMQTDAAGAIFDLMEAFKQLRGDEQSAALTQYFGSESVAAIAPLLSNLDNLKTQFNRVGDSALYAGSMESEFASRAATTENNIQLAKNALDRLKITLGSLALPIVTKGMNLFSDAIAALIEKVPNATNKIARILKDSWESVKPLFKWIKDNPMLIAKFVAGIGSAITASKVIENVQKLTMGIKGLQLVFAVNPIALALTAAAGAIAFFALNAAEASEKIKKGNLSDHFGKISLSVSELENVAKRVVRTNNLDKLSESLNALSEMEGIQKTVSSAVDKINKLNWKVSIGLSLTEGEKESYKQNVVDFVNETQNLLLQKRYAINLSMSVLTNDDENGAAILDKVNNFYQKNYDELATLGSKLQEAVNIAFEDGFLDIDEQKTITELQQKMAAITDALAKSQYEAKLEVMGMAFDGTALTGENFKELQHKINEEVQLAAEQYQESLTLNISTAKVMLDQGSINIDEYDNMIGTFKQEYLQNLGDIELKAANFQFDTIMKAYENEFAKASPEFAKLFDESFATMIAGTEETGMWGAYILDAVQNIGDFKGLDKATKANFEGMFNNMRPMLDEMMELASECEQAGAAIPEALSKGILDISTVGAMIGDVNSICTLIGANFGSSEEYSSMLKMLEEQGAYIPEELTNAIKLQYPAVEACATGMAKSFMSSAERELSKGITANIPLNFSMLNNKNIKSDRLNLNIPQYATGSDFTPNTFIAGEKGPELITNAKGSKVFTAIETASIFKNINRMPQVLNEDISSYVNANKVLPSASIQYNGKSTVNLQPGGIFNDTLALPEIPDYPSRYDNLFSDGLGTNEASEHIRDMKMLQASNAKYESPVSIQLNNTFTIQGGNGNEADMKRQITEALYEFLPQIRQSAEQAALEAQRRQKIWEERKSNA